MIGVLEDPSKRGQVLKMSKEEARIAYSGLFVASQGALSKDTPDGTTTARQPFDGTNGIVN